MISKRDLLDDIEVETAHVLLQLLACKTMGFKSFFPAYFTKRNSINQNYQIFVMNTISHYTGKHSVWMCWQWTRATLDSYMQTNPPINARQLNKTLELQSLCYFPNVSAELQEAFSFEPFCGFCTQGCLFQLNWLVRFSPLCFYLFSNNPKMYNL